ncbi:MAG: FtsQ-type POTRA domain-containing protein [Ruminococcus sp.]|nr:FtsQ-type POTRA domain-containing protein [Ruminococcus sp.]
MNDVEKTNIERKNSGKRMRRRRRMMSVYTVVVILLVLTVGVTMCFTFLFNIDEIVISGESETYTYMEIVEASGIHAGDNLLRLDYKKAEQRILDSLLYVETATVDRDFPSTLRITVTRCIPAYNVQYDKGVLLVSRNGKILADNNFYTDTENLPIIYGFEPADTEAGKPLRSKNENKYDAFTQLISRFDKDDNTGIASIDLSNEYAITVNYRNGLMFKMGNWNDVEYKLDLAQEAMNDEGVKGKKGYLMMIGSHVCSFRPSGELAEETEPAIMTDANGIPINTTTTTTTAAVPDYSWQDDGGNYNEWQDDGGGNDWQDNGQADGGEGWYGDDFGYGGYENNEIYDNQ